MSSVASLLEWCPAPSPIPPTSLRSELSVFVTAGSLTVVLKKKKKGSVTVVLKEKSISRPETFFKKKKGPCFLLHL